MQHRTVLCSTTVRPTSHIPHVVLLRYARQAFERFFGVVLLLEPRQNLNFSC